MGPEGSVSGLHHMKLAIDDLISQQGEKGLGKFGERALLKLKEDLLTVLDDLSPTYGAARTVYAGMSRPLNQMHVGQALLNKLEPALTQGNVPVRMNAETFARALREGDVLAQRATGFEGATLAGTMKPNQLATLEAVKADLARSAVAANIGKGVGSNTFQNLAQENLMQAAGVSNLPQWLSRPVQLSNYILRALYGSANEEMKRKIAQAPLNPQEAAQMMQAAIPTARSVAAANALRGAQRYIPGAAAAPTMSY